MPSCGIPFEEGAYETPPPQDRAAVIPRQVAAREAATHPECAPLPGVHFTEVKSTQIDEADAARERLGDASNQPGRGAAEKQEPRGVRGPVHEHADRLEKGWQAGIGRSMNLKIRSSTTDLQETRARWSFLLLRAGRLPTLTVHPGVRIVIPIDNRHSHFEGSLDHPTGRHPHSRERTLS